MPSFSTLVEVFGLHLTADVHTKLDFSALGSTCLEGVGVLFIKGPAAYYAHESYSSHMDHMTLFLV